MYCQVELLKFTVVQYLNVLHPYSVRILGRGIMPLVTARVARWLVLATGRRAKRS